MTGVDEWLKKKLRSVRTNVERERFTALGARRKHTVGVDLGQTFDPTAIVVVESTELPRYSAADDKLTFDDPTHAVRHLERIPLRTTYPVIAEHVAGLLGRPPLNAGTKLVIDLTGVGRPVFDIFSRLQVRPIGITITGGADVHKNVDGFNVPKIELVSCVQRHLHRGSLKISEALPDAAALVTELQNFRVTYSSAGNALFKARSGAHDDLVLSLAIAIWFADRPSNVAWSGFLKAGFY